MPKLGRRLPSLGGKTIERLPTEGAERPPDGEFSSAATDSATIRAVAADSVQPRWPWPVL